jgi:para-aminobenzoate synthetase component 1
VHKLELSAKNLYLKLLKLSETETVCLLDSCGINYLDSKLLIAGILPSKLSVLNNPNPDLSLTQFNNITNETFASIFTISYEFGLKLENIKPSIKEFPNYLEPDIFIAGFENLIFHNYETDKTFIIGNPDNFLKIEKTLFEIPEFIPRNNSTKEETPAFQSNFTRQQYISKVLEIQEYIKAGDTYQTNLTQQFSVDLSDNLSPQQIFFNLRNNHPAPFSSFIRRKNDFVISISPERFFNVKTNNSNTEVVSTSPIKGTRPRGKTPSEDTLLREDLLNSPKDRAENTMIVDLLRNDLGRICQFGSVNVEKLCNLEEHPSLFHLVSTISGKLKPNLHNSDVIKALFPCGSITGCPKIRTMEIIDELETATRGLSMGAIGYSTGRTNPGNQFPSSFDKIHSSVAIRTMVVGGQKAVFNVGGGIVIDSIPLDEYKESMLKARALMNAIGINID